MGAGLPYELEEYVLELERRAGYRHVYSPVLGNRELYEISGHWSHYNQDMYPPMEVGGEQVPRGTSTPARGEAKAARPPVARPGGAPCARCQGGPRPGRPWAGR